jgi:hypothetical protein
VLDAGFGGLEFPFQVSDPNAGQFAFLAQLLLEAAGLRLFFYEASFQGADGKFKGTYPASKVLISLALFVEDHAKFLDRPGLRSWIQNICCYLAESAVFENTPDKTTATARASADKQHLPPAHATAPLNERGDRSDTILGVVSLLLLCASYCVTVIVS